MSKILSIKTKNPNELVNSAQKIIYYQCTKCLEIAINASDNITSKALLILFEDPFIKLEERMYKSNKCPNSFLKLNLGIQ